MAPKLLFCCCLLCLPLNFLFGQYFAPAGAEWFYAYRPIYCSSSCELVYYSSTRDTNVGNEDARIVEGWNYDHWGDTLYLGAEILRGDSDRVYLWYDNQWRILADFTSQAGDTITVLPDSFPGFYFELNYNLAYSKFEYVVDSITTTFIDGQNLRVIHSSPTSPLSYSLGPAFTERIGHGIGNLPASCPIGLATTILLEYPGPLRCYEDPNFEYKNSPGAVCDEVILDVLEKSPGVPLVQTWPNPSTGKLKIKVKDDFTAELYDLQGRSIGRWKGIADQERELSLEGQSPGLFLLKIETSQGSLTEKILLQNH